MKKAISFILLLSMLTGCSQNTNTASKPVTSSEIITEETTSESPSEADTTAVSSTTSMSTTTSTQPTTAVSTSSSKEEKEAEITETSAESEPVVTTSAAEKPQENISAETTSAASTTSNAAQTTTTKATTTAKATTTTVRTEPVTEPPTEAETEPIVVLKHDGTDYGKAKAVYDYMVVHGTGTCVNYSYQTMQICKNIGLECLYTMTPAELYAHVANAVKVDGKWFVLDAYAECFLTENMCGFTQLLDENENFISDASILSSVRYDEL